MPPKKVMQHLVGQRTFLVSPLTSITPSNVSDGANCQLSSSTSLGSSKKRWYLDWWKQLLIVNGSNAFHGCGLKKAACSAPAAEHKLARATASAASGSTTFILTCYTGNRRETA